VFFEGKRKAEESGLLALAPRVLGPTVQLLSVCVDRGTLFQQIIHAPRVTGVDRCRRQSPVSEPKGQLGGDHGVSAGTEEAVEGSYEPTGESGLFRLP